jgi:hypothetical protein
MPGLAGITIVTLPSGASLTTIASLIEPPIVVATSAPLWNDYAEQAHRQPIVSYPDCKPHKSSV